MERDIRSAFKSLSLLNRKFKDTDTSFCAVVAVTCRLIDRTALLAKCTNREEQQQFGVLVHFPDVFSKLSAKHSSKIEDNLSKIHLLWQNLEAIQNDMSATFQKVWEQYERAERDVQLDCTRSLQKPISTCDCLDWLETICYLHRQLLALRMDEFETVREHILDPTLPSPTPTTATLPSIVEQLFAMANEAVRYDNGTRTTE